MTVTARARRRRPAGTTIKPDQFHPERKRYLHHVWLCRRLYGAARPSSPRSPGRAR
jgi:hypothetical protein